MQNVRSMPSYDELADYSVLMILVNGNNWVGTGRKWDITLVQMDVRDACVEHFGSAPAVVQLWEGIEMLVRNNALYQAWLQSRESRTEQRIENARKSIMLQEELEIPEPREQLDLPIQNGNASSAEEDSKASSAEVVLV